MGVFGTRHVIGRQGAGLLHERAFCTTISEGFKDEGVLTPSSIISTIFGIDFRGEIRCYA